MPRAVDDERRRRLGVARQLVSLVLDRANLHDEKRACAASLPVPEMRSKGLSLLRDPRPQGHPGGSIDCRCSPSCRATVDPCRRTRALR